ncbi:MAG: hypothetical protein ACPGGE_06725, partial [Poseidonia sp.]
VFTCLHCGGQFGYLPDEGDGMEAEVVPLAPDPRRDTGDAYDRRALLGVSLVSGLGIAALVWFFLPFIIAFTTIILWVLLAS